MTAVLEQAWAGAVPSARSDQRRFTSSLRRGQSRLFWLDGVRGVAALSVAVLHAAYMFHLPYSPVHAYLAVDLFFLLSGYVLAGSYDDHLRERGAWRPFMISRLRRLYPMVVVGIGLGAAVMGVRAAIYHDVQPGHLLIYTLFGLSLFPVPIELGLPFNGFVVNPVFWSILFEILVNLLYGLIAPRLRSLFLFLIIAAAAAAWIVIDVQKGSVDCGLTETFLGIPRVMFGFFLGVALFRKAPPRPSRASIGLQTLVGCGSLAVVAISLLAPIARDAVYDGLCIFILFPVVVTISATLASEGAFARINRLSGELSYPAYAVSHPVCRAWANAISLLHAPASLAVVGLLSSLVAAWVAAWVTWRWVDLPLRRALGRPSAPERAESAP